MEELYKDREKSGGILGKVDYKKLEVFIIKVLPIF